MNALNTFSILPETRDEVNRFVEMAVAEIIQGEYDPLKFWAMGTLLNATIEKIKKSKVVREMAIQEAAKYNGQEFMGCTVKVKTRKSYDYSECNSITWKAIKQEIERLQIVLDNEEKMLRSLTTPVADTYTGEMLYPARETGTEYIEIT